MNRAIAARYCGLKAGENFAYGPHSTRRWEASQFCLKVGSERHREALQTDNKTLQMKIADLWKNPNPVVDFLSCLPGQVKQLWDQS
ncbi:hypothetical protein [Oscillatoria acuminata]|uniref:Uncharacterized protein n=1 Tax=Oscillatoria acuminata PCC 6304 TaxID=56110 RepID=K9TK33_9CYAN|nr:hypothetical protein [Oscillatoria acuminata]AFY83222.1 hypothetical protein Oscil6304_3661 [Oscillatoria acuminata PCC 6304]